MKNIKHWLIVYCALILGVYNAHVKLSARQLLGTPPGKKPRRIPGKSWLAYLAGGNINAAEQVIFYARQEWLAERKRK